MQNINYKTAKEYLYLWFLSYRPLNDFKKDIIDKDYSEGEYLFVNQGFNLSSKYNVTHLFEDYEKFKDDDKSIKFIISENEKQLSGLYDEISDLKVFVGKNGSGKTTILKRLYKIIGGDYGYDGDDVGEFILIFKEGNHFYYHQSRNSKIKPIFNFKKSKENELKQNNKCLFIDRLDCFDDTIIPVDRDSENKFKSDLTIFYTGAVLDQPIQNRKFISHCYDISTNGLMPIDYSQLQKRMAVINDSDSFSAYIVMDMIRKIKFAVQFYDVFEKKTKRYFRLPNAISIVPSEIDIVNSINEISEKDKKNIELWMDVKAKQKGFIKKFCFAALLNHLKVYRYKYQSVFGDKYYNPLFYENRNIINVLEEYSNEKDIESNEKKLEINLLKTVENLADIMRDEEYGAFIFDLNDKSERKKLKKFIQAYEKLVLNTPFILMQWRQQSSGEENFIKIFARLYDVFLKEKKNFPSEITLIIDEADLYMHPDWQRRWLWEFMCIYKKIVKKIYGSRTPKLQLFFSTHSPFLITDLQEENVVLLKRDDGYLSTYVDRKTKIKPFGSNIYDLLKTGFFLEDFIGEYSKNKIEEAIDNIESKNPEKKKMSEFIIKRIGDEVFKSLIQEME